MKKLAVCVATKGHSEVVQDVLQRCAQDYHAYGIDIYYYDSSEDELTKEVVESFIQQGFDNLYYLKTDLDYESKILSMLKGEGLKEQYEYLWPSKDRSFFQACTLQKVMEAMEEEYDLIMLGVMGSRGIASRTYDVAEEFYRDWGWLATSLDVLIYKYSTMLVSDGQGNTELPRKDYTECWRVYATVFHRLAKMQTRRVRVLADPEIVGCSSPLGASVTYKNRFFQIWKDYWIQANEELPECYRPYSGSVLKRAASLPWIFGSVTRLKELHRLGELTQETVADIEKNWEKVSDVSVEQLRQIACGIEDRYHRVDLLGETGDSTIDILIEIYKMISEGKLAKAAIPTEDIMQCVLGAYSVKKSGEQKRRDIFAGSVKDILLRIKSEEADVEEMCKQLQILINFLLLME